MSERLRRVTRSHLPKGAQVQILLVVIREGAVFFSQCDLPRPCLSHHVTHLGCLIPSLSFHLHHKASPIPKPPCEPCDWPHPLPELPCGPFALSPWLSSHVSHVTCPVPLANLPCEPCDLPRPWLRSYVSHVTYPNPAWAPMWASGLAQLPQSLIMRQHSTLPSVRQALLPKSFKELNKVEIKVCTYRDTRRSGVCLLHSTLESGRLGSYTMTWATNMWQRYVRADKENDSKSLAERRAGSNPARCHSMMPDVFSM
jgi:hypothetical protein